MKKIIGISLILMFAAASFAQEGWRWQNPLPQGNDLEGIHSFNKTTAIAVGSNGTIIKTSDGGCSWDFKNSGTKEWLNAVCFVDDQTGWIAGKKGIILKTNDGGETWIIQNSTPIYNLHSIHFINTAVGWTVGSSGKILKTNDGGSTWMLTSFGSNVLSSVFFSDENNGWICGWFGSILKTTDGGNSWSPVAVSAIDNFYSLSFSDNLHGVAVGTGAMAHTANGGNTWEIVDSFGPSLNSVCLLSGGKGWAVGLGRAYAYTDNGGLSWVHEPGYGGYNHLQAVSAADEYSVWMAGEYGDIFKSTCGTFCIQPVSTGTTDDLRDICFVNENTGWTAGGKANPFEGPTVYKTTNGGIHWVPIILPLENTIFGIDFVNENTGWAVGSEGLIFKTSDGGMNWSTHLTNSQEVLYDVTFLNDNIGWAVGSTGTIYKTMDAGNTWNAKTSGTVASLWSVFFINENMGWIAGTGGTILKTVNGGESWEKQVSGYTTGTWLQDVFFIDENRGWIAGVTGRLLKTTDGGNTWTVQVVPTVTSNSFSSVIFIDENKGWACGSSGTIVKTTDGGVTWPQENTIAQYGLNSVFFTDANTGWVTGDGGVILKYSEPVNIGNLSHNKLNMSITDFNTTEDVIVSNHQKQYLDYFKLSEVEVLLDTIFHSSDADLTITLSHSGITDTLVNRRGNDGDNFISTRLFDASAKPVSAGNAPFTGDFEPDSPLKSFLGLDPNGEWKLSIYDGAAGNTGSLQAWGLRLYFSEITDIENESEYSPEDFSISQNYPNPFSTTTIITWQMIKAAHVDIRVYDFTGREVKTLVDGDQMTGEHKVKLDASVLPAGIYFYQFKANGIMETKKMVVVK